MKPQELFDTFEKHVRLDTFPVAVRLMPPGETLPARTKRPHQDLDVQVTLCQGISFSRRYGWAVAIGAEDLNCPLAAAVFGFKPYLDHMAEGHACYHMYTETLAAGAKTELETEKVAFGSYEYVLSAPLNRTAFEPHIGVVYGNSAQIMRLVVAALWQDGGRIESSFSGRLDCADELLVPLRTDKPEVILPCNGDRVFAQTQDHEMAFSFPWSWAERLVVGLEGTHKGGVRYPIPPYLKYTPTYPPHYEKLNEIWQEQGE